MKLKAISKSKSKAAKKGNDLNAMAAEFVGTFALAGAVLASLNAVAGGPFETMATPLIAAVTLGLFVMSVGSISGTHINPAVTLGAVVC